MADAKPSRPSKLSPPIPQEPVEQDGQRRGEAGELLPATYPTRSGNKRTDY